VIILQNGGRVIVVGALSYARSVLTAQTASEPASSGFGFQLAGSLYRIIMRICQYIFTAMR
jgi:hypothetical protein